MGLRFKATKPWERMGWKNCFPLPAYLSFIERLKTASNTGWNGAFPLKFYLKCTRKACKRYMNEKMSSTGKKSYSGGWTVYLVNTQDMQSSKLYTPSSFNGRCLLRMERTLYRICKELICIINPQSFDVLVTLDRNWRVIAAVGKAFSEKTW